MGKCGPAELLQLIKDEPGAFGLIHLDLIPRGEVALGVFFEDAFSALL